MEKKRIVVGLSGGVDSAVAALLLKEQGHDVIGIFMKNWDDDSEYCSADEDAREARLVASALNIPFYSFNFVKQYWDRVFKSFLEEYAQGYTPNPDILCNKEIKFKCFLEKALELDVDAIATGHYAGIDYEAGSYRLLKGADPSKDQSYFLYALKQNALERSIFPLADLHKQEVRELAKTRGLPNWDRKDSVGICFIGERKFKPFLKGYLGSKPGRIQDPHGHTVGRHEGLMFHTIGQRQGLGIGGPGGAWYVVGKDIKSNLLIAAQGKDHPLLLGEALECSALTMVTDKTPPLPLRCTAKIRYRQQDQACTLRQIGDDRFRVDFDRPQRAISPKQSIVFYQGRLCLGGAIIDKALRVGSAPASPQPVDREEMTTDA